MTPPEDTGPRKPRARRGTLAFAKGLASLVFGLALILGLLIGAAWLFLAGRPVSLPLWAVVETESRLNDLLEDRLRVTIGGVNVLIPKGGLPQLRLQDLRVLPKTGGGFVNLPEVEASFSTSALLRLKAEPVSVRISGMQVGLTRNPDGTMALDLGQSGETPASIAAMLERIDRVFALPALATLRSVEAEALTFTLDDRRIGKIWTIGDGRASVQRSEKETLISLGLGLVGGGQAPATAAMTFGIGHGGGGARVSVRVDNIAAADLAAQGPLLAWLGVLDAPISGDLHAGLEGNGDISSLEGTLSVGAGVLQPTPGAKPLPMNSADMAFTYDPEKRRLSTHRVSVDSPTLRLKARAHADILETGEYITQVAFDEVAVDPVGVFEEPVRFSQGALDLRLKLNPFTVDVGQLSLVEEGRTLRAKGTVSAQTEGWALALDVELDRIRHDRLLALWPVGLVVKTRDWLVNNVQQGELFDVKAGIRLRPEHEPRIALGYEFREADVRFMPTLPPIKNGRGYSTIEGQTYLITVEDGYVEPPLGGQIAVNRSYFRVPDFTKRPAMAEIMLQTESSVTAAMSLLDQRPFNFLTKAGLSPELGEGRVQMTSRFELPLIQKLKAQEVDFHIEGEILDLRSDVLVKGRQLTADRFTLKADRNGVEVGGEGRLGKARFDATWHLPLVEGKAGQSFVKGAAILDQGFASEFLSTLGAGMMSGSGRAEFELQLPKGEAPELKLTSNLQGTALNIRELGWSKPAASRGKLEVEGRLRAPIHLSKLVLEGPGLAIRSEVDLTEAGALREMRLSQVKMGNWLDAKATVEGQGAGRPARVRVTSGTADLRHLPQGTAGGGGQRGGNAISVALDQVRVNAQINLTGVRGELRTATGGFEGRFNARLNGASPIMAQLTPGPRGTGIRVRSEDAGGALRAAGLFTKAHGGVLDLVMNPSGGAGRYSGSVSMADFRVRNMPVLADLLNYVSIVGLLEQLSSSGLAFGVASAQFRMTPDAIELSEGQAIGASFGVSLEGLYDIKADHLNLRGVISPFYLVNGIGAILTRPGEGLMGFTYRIRGTAAQPDVRVNPLSVLAPGFLRDLLRRPAARIEE